jgi:hypothetical protein
MANTFSMRNLSGQAVWRTSPIFASNGQVQQTPMLLRREGHEGESAGLGTKEPSPRAAALFVDHLKPHAVAATVEIALPAYALDIGARDLERIEGAACPLLGADQQIGLA